MTVASADINLQKNTQCEQNDEETVTCCSRNYANFGQIPTCPSREAK